MVVSKKSKEDPEEAIIEAKRCKLDPVALNHPVSKFDT